MAVKLLSIAAGEVKGAARGVKMLLHQLSDKSSLFSIFGLYEIVI